MSVFFARRSSETLAISSPLRSAAERADFHRNWEREWQRAKGCTSQTVEVMEMQVHRLKEAYREAQTGHSKSMVELKQEVEVLRRQLEEVRAGRGSATRPASHVLRALPPW